MVNKAWRVIPRPLLETVLNNHAQHHRVPHPLVLHGPRGVGKTTLILERLLEKWNTAPHVTGYVDFAQSIEDHHPHHGHSFPWASWSNCPPPSLPALRTQLESCLESMAEKGVKLGSISSQQIFKTLSKWNGMNTSLRRILQSGSSSNVALIDKASTSVLWNRALFALSAQQDVNEIDDVLGLKNAPVEESSYFREAMVALKLAKEVLKVQESWRVNAIEQMNRTGGFSRTLANSATDWSFLLLDLLSAAAEIGHFQPKLVINNIELLRHALRKDDSMVRGSLYHDSLIWRIIWLGVNEKCLPVIFVTSDCYYSYQAFKDFGFDEIFISRETYGWTPAEAKLHMVADYFSASELNLILDVLGPNPRHLFEIYALKQSNYYQTTVDGEGSTFEDIVDVYLAYLQETVVNPAMDKALPLLEKFANDARIGKIPKDRLRFGAPWRHPPRVDDPAKCSEWAKLQLLEFVHSFINAEFGINYLAEDTLEIFDDPAALALIEVGLLYLQRDPSFLRPISRGIQRCLVRWFVQERLQLSRLNSFQYMWQRLIRCRSYRHLMKEIGYDKR